MGIVLSAYSNEVSSTPVDFDPTSVGTVLLDHISVTSTTTDGAAVEQWNDRIEPFYHHDKTGIFNGPLYLASPTGFNAKRALDFYKATTTSADIRALRANANYASPNSVNVRFFCVFRRQTTDQTHSLFGSVGSVSGGVHMSGLAINTASADTGPNKLRYWNRQNSASVVTWGNILGATNILADTTYLAELYRTTSGAVEIRLNGAIDGTGTDTGSWYDRAIQVGALYGINGSYFVSLKGVGPMAYYHVLTGAEADDTDIAASIRQHCADEYGVTLT
jgi:hypothetical protein